MTTPPIDHDVDRAISFLGAHIHDTTFAETLAAHGYPVQTSEEFQKAAHLADVLAARQAQKVASTPTVFDIGLHAAGVPQAPAAPDFEKYARTVVADPDILAAATRVVLHDLPK